MNSSACHALVLMALSCASADAFCFESVVDEETLPYKTAQEATSALKAQSNLVLSHEKLWDNYQVPNTGTYWIVFRSDSPFYPSVVRRRIGISFSGPKFKTAVICNAAADACDTLNRWLSGRE